jgi:hypothetical protein
MRALGRPASQDRALDLRALTGWLGDLDSNQGFPSQSRKFYR